ncbi:MAG: TetR family transcriptional regulator [Actinobacteria bacterium]|nr:TetR family transcriptional regulator [Actinomycetota bacterium]
MPKLGMEPIRREQICRAAASVIARSGFAGTTMRGVAEQAGVSTGMLNHYFANRQELLTETLSFVSTRAQALCRAAVDDTPAGIDRLVNLLDCALDVESMGETWRVWIIAYGEAAHLPEVRSKIEGRLQSWYRLLDFALEGLVPAAGPDEIPWSWRLDAVLNGLALQAYTTEAELERTVIRDEVIHILLGRRPAGVGDADAAQGR